MARIVALLLFVAVLITLIFSHAPIYQDEAYHLFADRRAFLGIPNFCDVVSNFGFLWGGLLGLTLLKKHPFPKEFRLPIGIFFAGVAWVAFGSAYYHWAPDAKRLVWDRLPMSVAFSALLAAVIADRISARAGYLLTLPFVLLGVASVLQWHLGNEAGRGDLRFYFLVQFGTLLIVPGILLLYPFPKGQNCNASTLSAFGLYVLAKVFEYFDRAIFNFGGILSGHTLKHLSAALGCYFLYRVVWLRLDSTRSPL